MKDFITEKLQSLNVLNNDKLIEYIEFCITKDCKERIQGETELHHILPKGKTLFPEYKDLKEYKWNGVHLKYSDHYIAHSLLAEAVNDRGVIYAWNRMRISNSGFELSSKIYESLRKRHLDIVKETSSISNTGKVDVIINDKIVKIDKLDPRYISGELVSHHKGKKLSEETKQKISESLSGRKNGALSEETKQKISDKHKGREISQEWRDNISKGKKGKNKEPKPKIKCPYCGKVGGVPQMKQWHFDKCKLKG